MSEFGHLVSAGANDLTNDEKQSVRKSLAEVGIPYNVLKTQMKI